MNLAELTKAAEANFVNVRQMKGEGIEVVSGGEDVNREPACLYATQEAAMSAWLVAFDWLRAQRSENGLIWFDKPNVETYRITLGDEYGTYRVVSDRYVVRAWVGFEQIESEPVSEEEKPVKRKAKAA